MTEKQIRAIIDDIKASIAKTHDLVVKLDRALDGQNPVGDVMKFFDEVWMARYTHGMAPSVHYDFNRTYDPAQIKRLVNLVGSALEVKGRIARYFNDEDPFIRKNHHPFNLFVSRWNIYATGAPAAWRAMENDTPPPPDDCRHEPSCCDDAAHTSRMQREMRAGVIP